jgi:hypothetical protein
VNAGSSREAAVPSIGGRRFFIYEGDPADGAGLAEVFGQFDSAFDPAGAGPVGLCVPLAPGVAAALPRDAVWADSGFFYAGTQPDGAQLRVRYFDGAAIGPGLPNSPTLEQTKATVYNLDAGHSIVPLADAEAAGPEDVLALWAREGAVPEPEAQRRVHEVQLVALAGGAEVVGVTSCYLQRNRQLDMDLWYYRAFVSREHRKLDLAGQLAIEGRKYLEARWTSGEDDRAAGIAYEVENPGLKSYFNKAHWMPTDFWFIGENERGDHVRVHYFPGAEAPAPD